MSAKMVGLFLVAASVGLVSVPREVDAARLNINGAICQPYNAGQANDIDYVASGIRNLATTDRSVTCSVPRSAGTSGPTPQIFVSGVNYNGASSSGAFYAHRPDGTFVGSTAFNPPTGVYISIIKLTPAQVPSDAMLSVYASLPGNGNGVLREIGSDQ